MFDPDRPAVIQRALAAGVTRIVCVGTDIESSRQAIRLAREHEAVFAAVGWHPNHAAAAPGDVRPALAALAREPKVVALGETGLDYYRRPGAGDAPGIDAGFERARQCALFQQHLEVAAEVGLNVVVHQRGEVAADLFSILAPFAARLRAQFHCFVGGPADLGRILALGSLVSFTGIVSFPSAANVRQALAEVPRDRFLFETDAPYLAPVPRRGERCEPAHVVHTAEVAATVRGMDLAALSAATCRTAHEFFPRMT